MSDSTQQPVVGAMSPEDEINALRSDINGVTAERDAEKAAKERALAELARIQHDHNLNGLGDPNDIFSRLRDLRNRCAHLFT